MNLPNREICPMCRQKKVRLFKYTKSGGRTDTYIFVCVNPDCILKIDLSKLISWNK